MQVRFENLCILTGTPFTNLINLLSTFIRSINSSIANILGIRMCTSFNHITIIHSNMATHFLFLILFKIQLSILQLMINLLIRYAFYDFRFTRWVVRFSIESFYYFIMSWLLYYRFWLILLNKTYKAQSDSEMVSFHNIVWLEI